MSTSVAVCSAALKVTSKAHASRPAAYCTQVDWNVEFIEDDVDHVGGPLAPPPSADAVALHDPSVRPPPTLAAIAGPSR